MQGETPPLIDNFPPNTLLSTLKTLLPQTSAWDIATGTFDIGSLLALDGFWQPVQPIRILMGDETTKRTRKELLDAIDLQANEGIETAKEEDDFASLTGLEAIRQALTNKQVQAKVYHRAKFHAKAHILESGAKDADKDKNKDTHKAIIGSSNFTRPGLSENVELNMLTSDPTQVQYLKDWFDRLWRDADAVTPELIKFIERHLRAFTPFEIWAKALYEYFAGRQSPLTKWEQQESVVFPILSHYQQDGYRQARWIAERWGGAYICDSPGLGKTYISLMLLEYYLYRGERILLIVPKSARESVWERDIKRYLYPRYRIACEEHLKIHNHTDFGREGTVSQERLEYYRDYYPIIIIDEAHHFRTPWANRSKVLNFLLSDPQQDIVYFVTATPLNNSALDLYHLINYLARDRQSYFAPLGIHNLRRHFRSLEEMLDKLVKSKGSPDLQTAAQDADILRTDQLLKALFIQRSRKYVQESEKRFGKDVLFPERQKPRVITYSLRKVYAGLYDDLRAAFSKEQPLLTLAIYNHDIFKKVAPDKELLNRNRQLVGLVRTLLLKRLESSCVAFEASLEDLLRKMAAFLDKYAPELWQKWLNSNNALWEDIRKHYQQRMAEDDPDAETEEDNEFDGIELRPLDKLEDYKLDELFQAIQNDMDILANLIDGVHRYFKPENDDKLNNLVDKLNNDPQLKKGKVIIFTEFKDTARYLLKMLRDKGFKDLEEIDSTRKLDREEVIKHFAPYYNCEQRDLPTYTKNQIRYLISTDVLSEGLNLQDASLIINYDLHWNPVRLMQRIGRIDRRLVPEIENLIGRQQPVKVFIYNFLPPEELNDLLHIWERVTGKLLRISKTMGIESPLLTPADEYEALKLFNERYEGEESIEEKLSLELEQIRYEHPQLWQELPLMPKRILSGKKAETTKGLFCAYRFPNPQDPSAPGEVRWYFRHADTGEIWEIDRLKDIADAARCHNNTPRVTAASAQQLTTWRLQIENKVKEYLKALQAPQGTKPILICWLEVC